MLISNTLSLNQNKLSHRKENHSIKIDLPSNSTQTTVSKKSFPG